MIINVTEKVAVKVKVGIQGPQGLPGAGATTFLALTDTPSDYIGNAGKIVKVNTAETAVEFDAFVDGGTW